MEKQNLVFCSGKNTSGELGIGNKVNQAKLTKIKITPFQGISGIAVGGRHVLIVDRTGKLFVCGADLLGLLGDGDMTWTDSSTFTELFIRKVPVVQIACAEFHSLVLFEDFSVYSWGGTLHKKTGIEDKPSNVPNKINSFDNLKVVKVACGEYHSLALTARF